jgi:hypothetical protein
MHFSIFKEKMTASSVICKYNLTILQGIPLRDHKRFEEFSIQNEQSVNDSNFRYLLQFRFGAGGEDRKKHINLFVTSGTDMSHTVFSSPLA